MCFTSTIEAIRCKDITCLTAALEPGDKLGTDLLTASIGHNTLLDIWLKELNKILFLESILICTFQVINAWMRSPVYANC